MFKTIANLFVTILGKIHWDSVKKFFTGSHYELTVDEQNNIRSLLQDNYYIILTRRETHLSTYAINISHLFLTGRLGYYSHGLMNLEDTVNNDADFRLIEATGAFGVAYTEFMKVFDCDSVALLRPKNMSADEWVAAMDKLKQQEGKEYDTLYDLRDDAKVSCVELIRTALKGSPNYDVDFANFEKMIAKASNLDPQMIYECPDFIVEYEVRH